MELLYCETDKKYCAFYYSGSTCFSYICKCIWPWDLFCFLFLVIEEGTLLSNLIHYCSWSRWLSVYGSLSIFWSFTLLAIMCTNSFRFLPSVKKLGVSMFMSCPLFAWMIKEKENHILCIFGWKTRRICHFQKRKAEGKFRLHMVLDHNLFLYTNVP